MDFVRVWLCLRCTPRVYAAPLQIYQFIYRTVPIARSFACLCMHACAQARVRVRVRVHALKMDKLRTNHKGTYELQDHRFRSVLRISTVLRRCVYCWIYVESYSSYASYPFHLVHPIQFGYLLICVYLRVPQSFRVICSSILECYFRNPCVMPESWGLEETAIYIQWCYTYESPNKA